MEGDFVRGSLVKGTKVQFNGDIKIEGQFKDGLLHGEGSIECKSMRSIYKGNFVDGSKHGMGEEVLFNKRGIMCSKYIGLFSNGKKSGLGSFEFRDVGFPSESDTNEKARLQLHGYWLSGQPKSGGLIAKDLSSFAVPTPNNPSSKFRWIYRFKKVQDRKECEQDYREKEMISHDVEFRQYIEMKKKRLFDKHRQLILSTLLSKVDKNDEKRKSKNDNMHDEILPSKAKYFKARKFNKGPKTLVEAINNSMPGLAMVDNFKEAEQGVVRTMVNEIKQKWLETEIELNDSLDMKMVEEEYNCLDEEWSIIDVNKINEIVQLRKEKEDVQE